MKNKKPIFPSYLSAIAISISFFLFFGHVHAQSYVPISNNHNGISIEIDGTLGVDYIFDRYYFDPLVNDCGICYIKSDVNISFVHNENNSRIKQNNTTEIIGGDFGDIRYKVDKDWQQIYWGGDDGEFARPELKYHPKYVSPLSFDDMEYESGVPIVGNTGFNPDAPLSDRANSYSRGLLDKAGNEYHYLTYGDDDDADPQWKNTEMSGSDGKSMLFCVNPKTPVIWLTAAEGVEYYTTPGKVYWVPKFHEQTSYIVDDVNINLKNIMDASTVYYRFDGGPYTEYTGAISSNMLTDGEHILDFYYNESNVQSRKIVKNPDHPSKQDVFEDGSGHGYLLWRNEAEFLRWKERMTTGYWADDFTLNKGNLDELLSWQGNQGLRNPELSRDRNALMLALVPLVDGIDNNTEYFDAAKVYLLNNPRMHIENIGFELNHSYDANPSHELTYRGYYDDWLIYGTAFIYDILAKNFLSDQVSGGISPIEDLRIRDMLAQTPMESMMNFGAFSLGASGEVTSAPTGGMWTTARQSAALCAALAMPSYNTHYYGTSGFDGTSASHVFTPYPDYPESWKDLFLSYTDNGDPSHVSRLHPFPNRCQMYNWYDGTLDEGLIRADGSWHDRRGYADDNLMGHGIEIFYNIMKRKFNMVYQNIDKFIEHSASGTLIGHKYSLPTDYDPIGYPRRNMTNEYFPHLATLTESAYDEDNKYFYTVRPYAYFFFNPDWEDVVLCESELAPSIPTNLAGTSTDKTITLSWTASTHEDCYIKAYKITRNGEEIASVPVTQFTDTGLAPNTEYNYAVAAVSAASIESEYCSSLQISTLPPVVVSTVNLSPETMTLVEGKKGNLSLTILPDNATDKRVNWSSSAPTIASVDTNGVVSALAVGQAKITVSSNDGGLSDYCDITVNEYIAPIGFVETVGEGTASTIAEYSGWDNDAPIVFSGYNTNPGQNRVESTTPSDTYPSASGGSNVYIAPGYSETAWFLIEGINTSNLRDITLSFGFYYTSVTARANFHIYISTDGSNWIELEHDEFPSASTWGLVTCENIPSATKLSIKFEETVRKGVNIDDIIVSATTLLVESISISDTSIVLDEGQSANLTTTVLPSNATNKTVDWSTSDDAVATVSEDGQVLGIAEGTCTITVKSIEGAHSAVCNVTVNSVMSARDEGFNPDIRIYPNPVCGNTFIVELNGYSNDEEIMLQINDIAGKLIYSAVEKLHIGANTISCNDKLNNGVYIITLSNRRNIKQYKLIVE